MRGWPVNWFLQLDPLVAIGNIFTTHTLYQGLLWALVTIVLTILLGRFFCGWVCPFGTMHQFFGYLGNLGKKVKKRIENNHYRKAQNIKYFILIAFLVMALFPLTSTVSLQSGLLDPIPLVHRSVNLILLPIVDHFTKQISISPRYYDGAWVVGAVFLTFILLNFLIPRFYCRFICPLGALFGFLGGFAIWRIGKTQEECTECALCEDRCEGACEPFGKIRISECLLCFNCIGACRQGYINYQTQESLEGEITNPDFGRRGFILSLASGVLAIPMIRLTGQMATNWSPRIVRPPGTLMEEDFLKRCIKCDQCMRVCPTNIITPGGLDGGIENLWTPVLNFRVGTSGCQLNCTACGMICPTSAIRPISLDEKLGKNEFAEKGPIRIGTAFVDRGRCLPWAMDKPCIVCQENCPVTPKAIYVKISFATIRNGEMQVKSIKDSTLQVETSPLKSGIYSSGDYYMAYQDTRLRITANTENQFTLESPKTTIIPLKEGDKIELQVRLQAPVVDIEKCTGCGVCEHECPVSGFRAIRVTPENETRSINKSLLLKRG